MGLNEKFFKSASGGGVPVGTDNFAPVLYVGNSPNSQSISSLNFKPDLVWMKNRDAGNSHALVDSVRGRSKVIYSDASTAEATSDSGRDLVSFNSNGFTVGQPQRANSTNKSGDDIVAWCWRANGAAVQNNDGTINGANCLVSANQASGFSIVNYSGSSAAGTVGHGLTSTPELIIIKRRTTTNNWLALQSNEGVGGYLDLSNAMTTSNYNAWTNNTSPNSNVVSLAGLSFLTGSDMLMYCWHSVAGYQKVGSYLGNSSTTGRIIYTTDNGLVGGANGFRPRFLMVKSLGTGSWWMVDSVRSTTNPRKNLLASNENSQEIVGTGTNYFNFNATSFQPTTTTAQINGNNVTYIYLAIA